MPELADLTPADFELFATPIINLFERECNVIELDPRKTRQVLHADRTRPRDFEIYRVIRVEDADTDGADAEIPELFSLGQNRGNGWVYSTERRPRRATEDERREGVTRTSYTGDDVFLTLSRPAGRSRAEPAAKRVDVMALCTNRDLPILDDTPTLTLESRRSGSNRSGCLARCARPSRPSRRRCPRVRKASRAPTISPGGSWRSSSLNFLSLAKEGRGVDPLHALLDLYADRGDPSACPQCALDRPYRLAAGNRKVGRSKDRCASGEARK